MFFDRYFELQAVATLQTKVNPYQIALPRQVFEACVVGCLCTLEVTEVETGVCVCALASNGKGSLGLFKASGEGGQRLSPARFCFAGFVSYENAAPVLPFQIWPKQKLLALFTKHLSTDVFS